MLLLTFLNLIILSQCYSSVKFIKFKETFNMHEFDKSFSNFEIIDRYEIGNFKGIALFAKPGHISASFAINTLFNADYIEWDSLIKATNVNDAQCDATWNLAKVSRGKSDRNYYIYDSNQGSDTIVYVMDSGIYINHPDFENRASVGISLVKNENGIDKNGHGTHVAGIIGSATYGVAKKSQLISVQILDQFLSGYLSTIVSGLQWIYNHSKTHTKKSVINLSVNGVGVNKFVNDAIDEMVRNNISVVVSAGNYGSYACMYTPSSAKNAIVVSSINDWNEFSKFSNHGKCVTINAPGENIYSTHLNDSFRILDGTSMAAPHVTGVIALFRTMFPNYGSFQIMDLLLANAQEYNIFNLPENTTNKIINNQIRRIDCSS